MEFIIGFLSAIPKIIKETSIETVLASITIIGFLLSFKYIWNDIKERKEKQENKEKDSIEILKEINNKIKNLDEKSIEIDKNNLKKEEIEDLIKKTEKIEEYIQHFKEQLNDVNNKIEKIDNKVSGLEEKIVKHIDDQEKEKEEEKKNIEQKIQLPEYQTRINNEINEDIQQIYDKIKCDKIDVYIFSNGTKSTDGIYEFVKFNHTHAKIRAGVELVDLEPYPYGLLSSFFTKLYRHKVIKVDKDNINNFEETEKKWIKNTGAEVSIFGLIDYCEKEKQSGFIVMQFVKESSQEINIKNIRKEFLYFNSTLRTLKNLMNKQ